MRRFVTFEIKAQRCPYRSGSAEAEDDAAAIGKTDANALLIADRSIHGIVIGEVVSVSYRKSTEFLPRQPRQGRSQIVNQLVGNGGIHLFVVMAGIVIPAIDRPVILDDIVDALLTCREHVEPEQHGPEPVFPAHMVGAG